MTCVHKYEVWEDHRVMCHVCHQSENEIKIGELEAENIELKKLLARCLEEIYKPYDGDIMEDIEKALGRED